MDSVERNIVTKLKELDVNIDSLKPFEKDYLIQIESIISNKVQIQEEAIKTLKANKFSLSSIAKEIGCSRTTFYNNRILKAYIELSEVFFNEDNPYKAYEDLKTAKSLMEAQVDKMVARDVHAEIVSHENKELHKTIKEKNKEINRLQARVAELSNELQNYRTQPKVHSNKDVKSKNQVIDINKHK